MSVIVLNCNACGEALEASAEARFVTCLGCGGTLEVEKSRSAAWTRLIEEDSSSARAEQPQQQRDELHQLRVAQALARVDRQWDGERQRLSIAGGRYLTPSRPRALCLIWAGIVLGGSVGASRAFRRVSGADPDHLWPWLVLALAFCASGVRELWRARRFQLAREDYERRREAIRKWALRAAKGEPMRFPLIS